MLRSCYKVQKALIIALFLGAYAASGQSPASTPVSSGPPKPVPTPSGTSSKLSPTEARVKRWLEIDQLTAGTRYHFIENANKRKAANSDQYQITARFRFKFDPKGKYSVAAGFETGSSFTSGWNNTGWGTGKFVKNLPMRQLYFDAKPRKDLEIQFGGLYVNWGENTEAVTYDNDSYIQGERVMIRSPKRLFFDEISVTYASMMDISQPQLFRRLKHFDNQNYHQFLIRKQINKFVRFSADYTFQSGIDSLHQAIRFKIPARHLIDNLLFEQYERLDPDKDYGFNIFADRQVDKRFTLGGGFARVNIPSLNADRFPPGKRLYFNGQWRLSPEFAFSLQFTQGVGFIKPTVPRTRLNIFFAYNILETLKRTRFF